MEKDKKKEENNKKTKGKRNPFKSILKVILILIVMFIVLYIINIIRNCIILNKIAEKQASYEISTNYSYTSVGYDSSENSKKTIINHYYKDGKNIMVMNHDDKKIIVWYDEITKENITIVPNELKATVSSAPFLVGNSLPYGINKENKSFYCLLSYITYAKVDGEKCYVINWCGVKDYINKENGTLVREINGKTKIDGTYYDIIGDFKDWKFNQLKDADMSRPNLTGYEVTER